MIAYNHKSLDHLLIQEEVVNAFYSSLVSKEESDTIKEAYPVNLYTPNLFIRIGLLLLTTVIILMGFGLFCLLTAATSEKGLGILAFIFSLLVYAALEFFIREKNHYRSGIDDALLWLSMVLLIASINLLLPSISSLQQSILIFILASYSLLRFGNALMGGIAFLSFLAIVFYSIIPLGTIAKTIMPFLLMAVSLFIYWFVRKNKNDTRLKHYKACCTLIEILTLVTLYAAGNYFVVREVSNEMFNLHLKEGESIPGGWFFWIITICLPVVYIFRGIQKRDVILLRTGLILVVAMVCTIRYYYHIAPLEITITVAGIVMILIAYTITKYLATPKYGFTHAEPNDPQLVGLLQLESLAIAQSFPPTVTTDSGKHTNFGGGSGGGGGATGQYWYG